MNPVHTEEAPLEPAESVLFWDFFGRSAQGTAEHFMRHLDDFLRRHGIAAKGLEVTREQPMHSAVQCTLAAEGCDARAIAQTLKASPRSRFAEAPR